jgi:hypothetical protein
MGTGLPSPSGPTDLAEAGLLTSLRQYGRHAVQCRRSPCGCGLDAAQEATCGPDLLAYPVLFRPLTSAVRRCEEG